MNINGIIEEGGERYRLVLLPIETPITHEECVETLVGSGVACSEREQTRGVEAGCAHSLRCGAIGLDPIDDLLQIPSEPRLDGAAITLTENTAPVPLAYPCDRSVILDLFAEGGTYRSQRH